MGCAYFSGRYRQQLKCHVCLSAPMPSDVNFGVRSWKGLLPFCGSKFHLRFPIARDPVIILSLICLSVSLLVTNWALRLMRMAPEGHSPSGPPRSPRNSCRLAKHFHSRARLCRLLVGLCPPTPHRSLRSLRRRGFAHYVRLRHYRSSLFCYCKIIPSHSFAALTALVVRRENGNVALLVCRGNGLVDQPRLACTSRRTPSVGALACAPGGGTLPPHLAAAPCRLFYGICCFQQKAYSNYTKVGCDCQ